MPQKDWNLRYRSGDTPWDSGIRSRELARVIEEEEIAPCRAAELGCGTGTNAVFLAQQGFDVTAFDVSEAALEAARRKAAEAGVQVCFVREDLSLLSADYGSFDFVFDRGCYHCVRRENLGGFLESLRRLTRPGTIYLVLTGNANEQSDEGIPRLREQEIREELGDLFDFRLIREFRFEDVGGKEGPLGWSCLLVRR